MMKTKRGGALFAVVAMFGVTGAFANAYVTVKVYDGQEDRGKVSGGNAYYDAGKAITLKATANKGYGFIGWYQGSVLKSCQSTWKYTTEGYERYFKAKFIAAKDDGFDLTDKKPSGYTLALGETPVASDCFAVTRRAEATALSETTIKVSGLPSGIKAAADPDPTKNGSVVFSGTAKKAGVYYVTFEAKNANGYVQSLTQKWIVGGTDPADGDFDDIGIGNLDTMCVGKGFHFYLYGNDAHTVKKLAASGLPSGLKLYSGIWDDGDTLDVDIEGYPTKLGKYSINFTKTYADKTVEKSRRTVIVKDLGSYYVSVDVGDASKGLGTVTGSGVYRVGGKIPLSAKPVNGNVFAGWFTDKACTKPLVSDDNRTELRDYFTASGDYHKASDSMTFYYEVISKARNIYAKFIPKESDWISLGTSLGSADRWESGPMFADGTTVIKYSVDSGTIPTVSAKGLPPGFKLNAKESWIEVDHSKVKPGAVYENVQLIAKNQTGKTDTKTFSVRIGNYKSYIMPELKSETDAYEAMIGEDMEWVSWYKDLKLSDEYGDWKVSATGLPPGVKAVYSPEDAYIYLEGMPTKAGLYTAVITFTRGSGATKVTEKVSFTVRIYEQGPALVGTFNGVTCWDNATYTAIYPGSRLVTITSAKGGKVTAKVGNMSFSGAGWVYDSINKIWVASLTTGKVKEGGKTWVYYMYIHGTGDYKDFGENDFTGYFSRWAVEDETFDDLEFADRYFFARQNCYGKGYWTDNRAAELATLKTLYFDNVTLDFAWEKLTLVTDKKAPIKVTVDKKGVLKLSGKVDGVSISGSTTLLPGTDGSLTGWLPIVEKNLGLTGQHIFRFTYKNGVPSLELMWFDPRG